MILGRKAEDKRREAVETANRAADAALAALARGDLDAARHELSAAPRKLDFADIGWKVALVQALIDLKGDKVKLGIQGLEKVCARIDDTNLGRDDRGYLRLFCLYRATEFSKDGRAPASLRAQADDFRFDQTLISPELKNNLPLKIVEEKVSEAPPKPSGPGGQ